MAATARQYAERREERARMMRIKPKIGTLLSLVRPVARRWTSARMVASTLLPHLVMM